MIAVTDQLTVVLIQKVEGAVLGYVGETSSPFSFVEKKM
jgi:hypothetical protein